MHPQSYGTCGWAGAAAPAQPHRLFEQFPSGSAEADFYVTQLRRAADEVGVAYADLTADPYREAAKLIRARGEEHEPLSRTVKFFGDWTRSKEALTLSEDVTPRRIQTRFNERRVGKIWKYTNDTLAHWLAQAVERHGRPMQVAEYEWWRKRELALAKARGDESVHISSAQPFRTRWRTWEGALLGLGCDPVEVDARPERGTDTTADARATVRRAPRAADDGRRRQRQRQRRRLRPSV